MVKIKLVDGTHNWRSKENVVISKCDFFTSFVSVRKINPYVSALFASTEKKNLNFMKLIKENRLNFSHANCCASGENKRIYG